MKASHIKGALLEYIVRNLLKSCGFRNVKPNKPYSFLSKGNFYVNGKGAAHDADVIMHPPIQMPFGYPTQLIFECKAYKSKIGLPLLRNLLGLRNDLNEFEVVTKKSLKKRKNSKRAVIAIEQRDRFLYQIGLAAVNKFSKPALEFATNNKIPILPLHWFLGPGTINTFNSISNEELNLFPEDAVRNLYTFLKDREGDMHDDKYARAFNVILNQDNNIGEFVTFSNYAIKSMHIGLLESGDLVFLFARNRPENNVLNIRGKIGNLKSELHWPTENPNVWRLKVSDDEQETNFEFFLPQRLFNKWKKFNLDKSVALDLKQEYFSKIIVFNKDVSNRYPFSIIHLDKIWFDNARDNLNNE